MECANGRTEGGLTGSEGRGKETETPHWKVKVAIPERHPFGSEILARAH